MEWLPGNKEYDLAGKYNIDESAIWIPVIPKK